jgi:hypothetical protein
MANILASFDCRFTASVQISDKIAPGDPGYVNVQKENPTGYEKNIESTRRQAVNKQACRGIRPVHSFCGRLPAECAVFSFRLGRFTLKCSLV